MATGRIIEDEAVTGAGLRRWRAVSLGLIALAAVRVEWLLITAGAGAHFSLLSIISFLVLSPLLLMFLLTIRSKGLPTIVQGAIYAISCAISAYLLVRAPFVVG